MELDLNQIRNDIDEVDSKLVKLFFERMALCAKVAEYKKNMSKTVRDDKREKEIISRLSQGMNELDTDSLTLLYNTIFEISRSRQNAWIHNNTENISKFEQKIKSACIATGAFPENAVVACQGVEGAYSQIACNTLFENPSVMYFENFESVFKSVQSGLCKYGVLPFENSIHGSVTEVYDMLSKSDVNVVRSVKLPIHHSLLAKKGVALSEITDIYSHRQAIGQCSNFLSENKKIKVHICENTAVAAKMVAQSSNHTIAAISSEKCASLYGLDILKRDLQNSGINFTMFYCISKDLEIYEDDITKAAFMFNIANRAGSLFNVLARFACAGVNLTKIESRPICGKDFEFMFYAEADTKGINDKLVNLFAEFEKELEFFKFIGMYKEITID